MEFVGVRDYDVGVQREPTLTTLCRRPCIPGDGECLQPTTRHLDQVLLEWIDAECVADLEVGLLPVGPLGIHDEAVASPEERGGDAARLEPRAVESAED